MKCSLASMVLRRLAQNGSVHINETYLQQWWVIEKCVEGPESGTLFRDVVGVSRREVLDLKPPYRQTSVIVIVDSPSARGGIATNQKRGLYYLKLSPIDYNHKVFPYLGE